MGTRGYLANNRRRYLVDFQLKSLCGFLRQPLSATVVAADETHPKFKDLKMSADWNWFFSSLSQSAAAIVGIFGAFIITKIFTNQTVFHEKKAKSRDLLIQAQKISDAANSFNIEWYNKYYNRPEYGDFHDHLEECFPKCEEVQEVTEKFLDDYIESKQFSMFSETDEIKGELRFIALSVFKDNQKKREQRELEAKEIIKLKESMKNNSRAVFLATRIWGRWSVCLLCLLWLILECLDMDALSIVHTAN